ncbi:hypothetical protein RRG08_014375 [Elysia crispata]|uniref:Uncharacterized protein n=1 Tax=Elysia crispata TaxID=231223 RepID=A0AAE0YNK8_9GAST|nr:hypothetical protein RRG08_014375 [Elysia crispata]
MGEPAGIFTRALVNLAMEVFGWESLLGYSPGPWLISQWKCLDGGEPAGIFTRALVNLAMEVFGWESLLGYSPGPWLISQWKCLDGRACWDIHQGLG